MSHSPTPARRRRWLTIAIMLLAVIVLAVTVNAFVVARSALAAEAGSNGVVIDLESGDLHVIDEGPRDAPGLVLLHGLAGSTDWYDAIVPVLVEKYRVVRIDLLGHGLSEKPRTGYDIASQGKRVGDVLDHFGITTAIVVGHSMGGLVAASLVEQREDLVSALVLIDTTPTAVDHEKPDLAAQSLMWPGIGQLGWRMTSDPVVRKGLASAFADGVEVPERSSTACKA